MDRQEVEIIKLSTKSIHFIMLITSTCHYHLADDKTIHVVGFLLTSLGHWVSLGGVPGKAEFENIKLPHFHEFADINTKPIQKIRGQDPEV
jgi:hypothetical protein